MTIDRISTLDKGYIPGDLSLYPEGLDTKDSLYQAKNNAITSLSQSLPYEGQFIVVDDTTSFPPYGLLLVGQEIIYYASKTNTVFQNLKRGFAGSRQNQWPIGTIISNAVLAEMHNALKDAIIKIETNLGLSFNPDVKSLNGILTAQEQRFLAPKPLFRGVPLKGPTPLTVKFQNFSSGDPIKFLWDFGDGGTSVDTSPTHTYLAEGKYDVKLNMITSLGAQGIIVKAGYIEVNNNDRPAFFYPSVFNANVGTTITFIDQTDGDIASRYWIWDDGANTTVTDPDVHTATHVYSVAGSYHPTLLVVFSDGLLDRVVLEDAIVIT